MATAQAQFTISDLNDGDDGLNHATVNLYRRSSSQPITPAGVSTSLSGSIVGFSNGVEGQPIDPITVNIEPIQDLHGYDNPWPAGGGVNKLPPCVAGTYTSTNCSAVVSEDGTITLSGTAGSSAENINIPLSVAVTSPATNYYMHIGNSAINSSTSINLEDINNIGATNINLTLSPVNRISGELTKTSVLWNNLRFWIGAGQTLNGTVHPMICMDNVARSYVPYSNICPISGFSAVNVTRTGKNLLNNVNPVVLNAYIRNNNTLGASANDRMVLMPVKKNTTYTWTRVREGIVQGTSDDTNVLLFDQIPVIGETVGTSTGANINISPGIRTFNTGECTYAAIKIANTTKTSYEQTMAASQLELGLTATDCEPHNGNTYNIPLGQTIYGGTLDVNTGVLTVTYGQIASYNGETLPGAWLSSMNIYVSGSTPTTGAQVVYELATPTTYQLTPTEITTLLGTNVLWADTGDISLVYSATGDNTYTFATGELAPLPAGWFQYVPDANGNPCWIVSAAAISSETTCIIEPSQWNGPNKLVEDGETGAHVIQTRELFYFKQSNTVAPDGPTSEVIDATGGINRWTQKQPAWQSGFYYWRCQQDLYSDGTFVWSEVYLDDALSSANDTANSKNSITYGTTSPMSGEPPTPVWTGNAGDIYIQKSTSGTGGDITWQWNSETNNWVQNMTGTTTIVPGSIGTASIAAGAVKANQIDSGAVTTEKLDAEAVTAAKIATGAITADKIDSGAVTTEKLDAEAVTAAKIATGAITADKIESGSVTVRMLADENSYGDNLFINTLKPDASTAANYPRLIGQSVNTYTTAGTVTTAQHGMRLTNTAATRPIIRWGGSGTTAGFSGLEPGKTYTVAFDYSCKLFSGTTESATRYLTFYQYSALDGGTSQEAQERKAVATYIAADKGTEKSGSFLFTFTIPAESTAISLRLQGTQSTASYYAAGDYVEIRNLILVEGSFSQLSWVASPKDSVSSTDLVTSGATVINGANITTGNIDVNRINLYDKLHVYSDNTQTASTGGYMGFMNGSEAFLDGTTIDTDGMAISDVNGENYLIVTKNDPSDTSQIVNGGVRITAKRYYLDTNNTLQETTSNVYLSSNNFVVNNAITRLNASAYINGSTYVRGTIYDMDQNYTTIRPWVIWENASPTSVFAGCTLPPSSPTTGWTQDDIDAFSANIKKFCLFYVEIRRVGEAGYAKSGVLVYVPENGTEIARPMSMGSYSSRIDSTYRDITINRSTGQITFGNGYSAGGTYNTESGTKYAVPTLVIGLNPHNRS